MVLVWSGGENWARQLSWYCGLCPNKDVWQKYDMSRPPGPARLLCAPLPCVQPSCAAPFWGAMAMCRCGGPLASTRQCTRTGHTARLHSGPLRCSSRACYWFVGVCAGSGSPMRLGNKGGKSIGVTSRNVGSPNCAVVVCCGSCGAVVGETGG